LVADAHPAQVCDGGVCFIGSRDFFAIAPRAEAHGIGANFTPQLLKMGL
jgi:hypothetical protein